MGNCGIYAQYHTVLNITEVQRPIQQSEWKYWCGHFKSLRIIVISPFSILWEVQFEIALLVNIKKSLKLSSIRLTLTRNLWGIYMQEYLRSKLPFNGFRERQFLVASYSCMICYKFAKLFQVANQIPYILNCSAGLLRNSVLSCRWYSLHPYFWFGLFLL